LKNATLDELQHLGEWYHDIDFGENVQLKTSKATRDPEKVWKNWIEPFLPHDLSEKTVLDLGCNSGYYSMKIKKLGAKRVVGVESEELFIKQADFVSRWFDADIELVRDNVYRYVFNTKEKFDYVLFLGVFYHLKYGVIVLDRLAEITRSRLFFQSAIIGSQMEILPIQDFSPEDGEHMLTSLDVPKMVFIEGKYRFSHDNWWLPNDSCCSSMLRSANLDIIGHPRPGVFVCESKNQNKRESVLDDFK